MKPSGQYYALYSYGSRVYGNFTNQSDWDYIGIQPDVGFSELEQGFINLKLMDPVHFQKLLDEHNVSALECLFLPESLVLTKPTMPWKFTLDLKILRHSFAEKASKSYVKAKKKFVAPYNGARDEIHRGKKSLFHSLRILQFGIQIAQTGKIVDYSCANNLFQEIMENSSLNWTDYQNRWQSEYNQLSTEFRKVAPK